MKIFFLQCVSLLLLFLFLNISPSKDVNTLQQTFEVTAGGTLILDTDLGSIEIFTWEQPQVKIDVFREFSGWDEDEISDFLENFLIDDPRVN